MRTGPGKHLKGLTLMGGMIKPEEARLRFQTLYVCTNPGFVTSLIISTKCVCRVDSLAFC